MDYSGSSSKDQGFDPRVILHQLIKNRKSYESGRPNARQWDLANVGDDLQWTSTAKESNKFTNTEPLVKDINFLITVFLSRNKILKKSRGGVEDVLCMLKEKYFIDDEVHSSGTTLGSRVITLPRIAGVFPVVAVRMFHDKVVKEIVSYESFPGGAIPETHAICCPLLPSIAPMSVMSEQGGNFHPVMLWVAVKLDDIIHRKDNSVTTLMDILSSYRAGYQSSATPDKARVQVFAHLGIIEKSTTKGKEGSYVLTANSAALAMSCLSSLGQMRQSDENHHLLLKVAKSADLHCF